MSRCSAVQAAGAKSCSADVPAMRSSSGSISVAIRRRLHVGLTRGRRATVRRRIRARPIRRRLIRATRSRGTPPVIRQRVIRRPMVAGPMLRRRTGRPMVRRMTATMRRGCRRQVSIRARCRSARRRKIRRRVRARPRMRSDRCRHLQNNSSPLRKMHSHSSRHRRSSNHLRRKIRTRRNKHRLRRRKLRQPPHRRFLRVNSERNSCHCGHDRQRVTPAQLHHFQRTVRLRRQFHADDVARTDVARGNRDAHDAGLADEIAAGIAAKYGVHQSLLKLVDL